MKLRKQLFLLVFISLLVLHTKAFTDNNINIAEDSPVLPQTNDLKVFFGNEVQIMEEKMKEINPQLVASVANDSDDIKIIKYNNWMADHIFNQYKDYIMADFYKRSAETGREIKSKHGSSSSKLSWVRIYGANLEEQWLDEGIMETDRCIMPEFKSKIGGCIEMERYDEVKRQHTCFYPDGFEEYKVWTGGTDGNLSDMLGDLSDSSEELTELYDLSDCENCTVQKQFAVTRDSKQEDLRINCVIGLYGSSYVRDEFNGYTRFLIKSACEVQNYTDWYTWRNNWQQDIMDGKYRVCKPKPGIICSLLYRVSHRCMHNLFKGEEALKWKASRNIPGSKFLDLELGHALTVSNNTSE